MADSQPFIVNSLQYDIINNGLFKTHCRIIDYKQFNIKKKNRYFSYKSVSLTPFYFGMTIATEPKPLPVEPPIPRLYKTSLVFGLPYTLPTKFVHLL